MKLVTYDRGGARRLGAVVADGIVLDLPDAVGHPAFPGTMEALVSRCGGTTLDVAREALSRPDWWEGCVVPEPRLLVPLLPSAARDILALGEFAGGGAEDPRRPASPAEEPGDGTRHDPRWLGPEAEVDWPEEGDSLDYEIELACVLGDYGRALSERRAGAVIFGYTLFAGWSAGARGRRGPAGRYVGASFGPCVVTADEFHPAAARIVARVDGEVWSEGSLAGAPWTFPELIARESGRREVCPGDLYGSGTFPGGRGRDHGRRLYPGAVVEVETEGIGVLRTRVGPGPWTGQSTRPRPLAQDVA